ncbi:hypothetical protein SporoP37_16675 (plasmid) [Sporosarcina sp. P37]|nr:hypothetical protein SporoP37_16675 [Sporosarcina sp. P37]
MRPAGELFFTHNVFVTNLEEAFTPEAIVRTYQKRGTMENYIKEAKNGFGFDRMCSHTFQVNEARMILCLLAYNFAHIGFSRRPETDADKIQTIRTRLVKFASKLVKS